MSGISSGAAGLNRAIAGYTEKTQISLCLPDKGVWLQISESGSDTQIYYWLRVYWLQVKRVGLRRPAAHGLKRSLRTFRTRSGVSSTSLTYPVFVAASTSVAASTGVWQLLSQRHRTRKRWVSQLLPGFGPSIFAFLIFAFLICHGSFIVCYALCVSGRATADCQTWAISSGVCSKPGLELGIEIVSGSIEDQAISKQICNLPHHKAVFMKLFS